MTSKILQPDFYAQPAEVVAPQLLGKYLVRTLADGSTLALQIIETEAYIGPHDLACHARVGRTARTEVMYGPPGHWYVYLIYGMYWMLNVVTNAQDYPAAVLFRGIVNYPGPGKLTRGLQINKSLNTLPAQPASGLWIEDRQCLISDQEIRCTPRIGIDYAGQWKDEPLRYVLAEYEKPAPSKKRSPKV